MKRKRLYGIIWTVLIFGGLLLARGTDFESLILILAFLFGFLYIREKPETEEDPFNLTGD